MITRYWKEFSLLFLIQMLEMRVFWIVTVLFSLIVPIVMVLGLGSMGSGQNHSGLLYIVTGSTVVSLVTLGIVSLSQEMAQMKIQGQFLYYASLPISKMSLLIAVLISRLLIQLPGILVILFGGNFLYHLGFNTSIWTFIIIFLALFSLSGVGGVIGLALDPQIVPTLASIVLFGVLFGSPVLIPLHNFPVALRWIGLLLPPTYVADALRGSLSGSNEIPMPLDIGVLIICTIVSFVVIVRGVRWQLR
ncbi:ABC transporter permease [Tengunoibacter tsumagoiensis]|uniref:ABC-2 type transporter transmembrane domain-containing protein n=1 Tax=Tengunoibacter tsumagoiensis TaxID=2014871 RepID=A0A402A655_9CHLR|nr:ABC transporter permease [Tengunoibacter tsumagoiensis]GCE14623.1 hypothetical protein KTT_44820 [Tengunoibacter tsumagoiensis]